MAASTTLRLAALTAAAYGVLVVSGIVHHFQRTGSLRALAQGLAQPAMWITLLVAVLLTWGLWKRYAWAWWLGVAAGAFQCYRLVSGYVQGGSFGRMPGAWTLIAFTLVVLLLVLLLQRRARLAANR